MIGILFYFGNEVIEIRVEGHNIIFRTRETNSMFAPLDGLRLSKDGCIKEYPDLKDNENWREETLKRFKEKIKEMETEMDIIKYLIKDLGKHGYKAYAIQKAGHRLIKL